MLRTVLRREPAYIGLLGSRKRGRAVLDFLAAEGFTPEELARVHVPVGLDLGAETAAEIALAAVAEALAVRNGRTARSLTRRRMIAAIVLAAGASKRFGEQKLVVPLGGQGGGPPRRGARGRRRGRMRRSS